MSNSSSNENNFRFCEPTLTENEDLPRRAKGAGQHYGLTQCKIGPHSNLSQLFQNWDLMFSWGSLGPY